MYQQKCPIYRNSKAVRDMVLLLMYHHDKHFLKGKLADDAEREHWRSLRNNVLSRLITDENQQEICGR
jgi:hypothetical protein